MKRIAKPARRTPCNFCAALGREGDAVVDVPTKYGYWAWCCVEHLKQHGGRGASAIGYYWSESDPLAQSASAEGTEVPAPPVPVSGGDTPPPIITG